MGNTVGEWELGSGTWAQAGGEFVLIRSTLGNEVSPDIDRADVVRMMRMPSDGAAPPRNFPPEFEYSPATGKPLSPPHAGASIPWVPPYGNPPAARSNRTSANGLRQYPGPLQIASLTMRRADGEPDIQLESPPPGEYEFFSAQFGAVAQSLIALNPTQGTLLTWLPSQDKWLPLDHLDERLIDVCTLARAGWRAELAGMPGRPASMLFLPTDSGLACVVPDVTAVGYRVRNVGDAPALGAPIAFDGKYWIPLHRGGNSVSVIAVDASGDVITTCELDLGVAPGEFRAPVAYSRQALWLAPNGRLRLQKLPDGNVTLAFTPWPTNITPAFDFGSPYLSDDGGLWQLCFNQADDIYVYVRVDVVAPEIVPTISPRPCSGRVNYRFVQRTTIPPWDEPSHGDDAGSNEFILPLLEITDSGQVLGLRLPAPGAIAVTLASGERLRAELVLEDRNGSIAFHTLSTQEPWRVRIFVHDQTLWVYHARQRRLEGWRLES